MTFRAGVALGSNLGNRVEILQKAIEDLQSVGHLVAVSSLYETAPVGGPDQGAYLNAVVLLDTDRPPSQLMRDLLTIESASGRVRVERWGPRTLDLDLIVVTADGKAVISEEADVILPHPRAHERRFVLEPLAEVWESAPLGESTAEAVLGSVGDQEVDRVATTGWETARPSWISPALVAAQFVLLIAFAALVVVTSSGIRLFGGLVGVALAVVGGVGGMWATKSLGSALTPFPEPKHGTVLVDEGPYRYVRHPIYTGVIVLLVGVATIAGSLPGLLLAVFVAVFFWFKAGYEESRLKLVVPGYTAYTRRVRGRLLPSFSRITRTL